MISRTSPTRAMPIESLYQRSVSAAAARRILQTMQFRVTRIQSIEQQAERIEVIFLGGKQRYVIRLKYEHFLDDWFRRRWVNAFDYELIQQEPDLYQATQGGNRDEHWVKVHGPGQYECDCADWISQQERTGIAVCKHVIRLGQLQGVSITEMIQAQANAITSPAT